MSRARGKTKIKVSLENAQKRAAEARRMNFAAVNLQPEASTLRSHTDVAIARAGDKTAESQRAANDAVKRLDAFSALRDSFVPGGYDAVRDFEALLTIRRGEQDRGRNFSRVDCDEAKTDRTDAMISAGRTIDLIVSRMGERNAWLVYELLSPSSVTTLRATTWRDIAAYVTGETNPVAQAALVKAAVKDLKDAITPAAERPKLFHVS
jgi:hypothetical protein